MATSRAGKWTTLQKLTPVIVGLVILFLLGLILYLHRAYRRRGSSRRAQGDNSYLGHRRNQSALSVNSASYLNHSPSPLSVHRIRFFFRGMFPIREQRRNSAWNIEGESTLSRRPSAAYDPPPPPEDDPLFTPTTPSFPSHDTPPVSSAPARAPFQTISRWVDICKPIERQRLPSCQPIGTEKQQIRNRRRRSP
jgi:hypothetical protein